MFNLIAIGEFLKVEILQEISTSLAEFRNEERYMEK